MKYLLVLFGFFLFLTAHAQHQSDSAILVQLLKDDYKTMVSWDIEKHKGYCTDDYILIENGEI